VIGYPGQQDEAILPARDMGFVPLGKFLIFWCFIPYNNSFINQACLVKVDIGLILLLHVYGP